MSETRDKTRRGITPLSKAEVAEYLGRLASLNDDVRTGNPALASALRNLARTMLKSGSPRRPSAEERHQYDNVTAAEVRSILADYAVGKNELVALAGARFSIPHARLNKLRRSEIQEAIEDALAHEESLDIIASEAQRGHRTN